MPGRHDVAAILFLTLAFSLANSVAIAGLLIALGEASEAPILFVAVLTMSTGIAITIIAILYGAPQPGAWF